MTPGVGSLSPWYSRYQATNRGNPTAIGSFSIYRGVIPTFPLGPSTRLATISNPSVVTYDDTGAKAAASNYFYLVTSTDKRGFVSGGGNELPSGIMDLSASLVTASTIHMSWAPVTTNVKGGPTGVAKYVLYASDTPIPRSRVDVLSPAVDNIQTNSVDVAVSPTLKYYTVIVVDLRGNKSPL